MSSKNKFAFWFILICVLSIGGGVYALTADWDAAYEASPADLDNASEGAQRIRNLKRDIRERLEQEHSFDSEDSSETGVHLEGSARLFVQDDAPTTTVGGETLDDGLIWFETDTFKLYYYNLAETAWIYIIDKDDWASLALDNIFSGDNSHTGAETFDDLIVKEFSPVYTSIHVDTTLDALTMAYDVYATSANKTITLPDASDAGAGRLYYVRKADSSTNSVIITRAGSDTIDGSTTYTMNVQYDYAMLLSDGNATWNLYASIPDGIVVEAKLSDDVADRLNEYTIFSEFGGDGSDGDITIDASDVTYADDGTGFDETAGDNLIVIQADNVTIDNAYKMSFAGNCLLLGVKGTITITNTAGITMDEKGGAGGAIGNGNPGNAGGIGLNRPSASLTPMSYNVGGSGGGGGGGGEVVATSGAGNGGPAGTYPGIGGAGATSGLGNDGTNAVDIPSTRKNFEVSAAPNNVIAHWMQHTVFSFGGGGGGGGSNEGNNDGIAGGDGGGLIYVEANDVVFTGTPVIDADGGNGTNGEVHRGASGGGGGGTVILVYKTTSGTATMTVTGGTGGTGQGNQSGHGGDGGDGAVLTWDVNG